MRPARAAERTEPIPAARDERAAASGEKKRPDTDLTVVPVAGGDSDTGFGGGFISSMARTVPGIEPYELRVEAAGMITFRAEGDDLQTPFLDAYVLLDTPHLVRGSLGMELRISHTHEGGLEYFGLGNASRIEPGRSPSDPRYEYSRTHPTLDVGFEYGLSGPWELHWGAAVTYNELSVPADGRLAEDAAHADPRVRSSTRVVPTHWVATFRQGVAWDTRDHEVSPQHGQYHTLRVDLSPGGTQSLPYSWMRINAAVRAYLRVIPERLVVAFRFVGDGLLGTPPFYELARYDNTYAVGGGKGVRGIPARRYYGKLKVLGNLELRLQALEFGLFGKPHRIGVVGFIDAGRVFAGYSHLSELDGSGLGLKVGYGGGLRFASDTFVVRADVATSAEAGKISGYLTAGQMF